MMRLDRLILSREGAASRSVAQRLVRRGYVTVGGALVRDPSARVPDDAEVVVDGTPCVAPALVLLLHKPAGVHSTVGDSHGRASLAEYLPSARYHPVGRLDAETTGLLLLSREGRLTQHLLHPRRGYEREYIAVVEGEPGPTLVDRLTVGVETAEGTFSARVEAIDGATVRLVVTEGKHRMVRRMLNNAGHPVLELQRIRFGPFRLGDLAEGELRPADAEELSGLPGFE